MNPLELRLKNYRTFENLALELPAGCAAIIGENGAGKSSLVNGIDLALFGPDGRSWAPYLTQGIADTELEVELVFEHAGAHYRVRRGYSARGNGKTTLDLEKRNGVGWLPATREGQRPTQETIEEIVGLTRETFRASAFLSQGDGAAFTEAKPADRKRVLSKVLGLERFDVYLDRVKADRNESKATVDRINGALERADQELEKRPDLEDRLRTSTAAAELAETALEQAQARLEQAAAQAQAIEQARAVRAEAEAAVSALTAEAAPLEERARAAVAAQAELDAAKAELAEAGTAGGIPVVEARIEQIEADLTAYRDLVRARQEAIRIADTRDAERRAILAQVDAKTAALAKLEERIGHVASGELDNCPTCTQKLGAAEREATVGALRAQAQTLDDEITAIRERADIVQLPEIPAEPEPPLALEQELAESKTAIVKMRETALQRERIHGRIQALQERVDARPDPETLAGALAALSAAKKELEHLPAAATDAELANVQAAALQARAAVDEQRSRSDAAKAETVRAQTELDRLAKIETDTAADREERERLHRRLDRLAVLERAYGRDGIPALIIQSAAIPAIENEAARILQELGGSTGSARIELRTEKALQSGAIADALDVVVATDRGERPYETFSGGERTRLNLALRIALARLLATRRGAESRILCIDEPEFLDEAGTAALARVLRGLAGDFERVYLISHVPDLRSAFDQTLEVVKNGDGVSRVA